MTETKSFVYNGPIIADHIIDDFLKDDQYLKAEVHGGPGYTTTRIINDGKNFVAQKIEELDMIRYNEQPYWFDRHFAVFFSRPISSLFFHLGLDYWRKNAKIAVFTMGVLVPSVIVIF